MTVANSVGVTEKDLSDHLKNAQALIEKTQWKVAAKSTNRTGSHVGGLAFDTDVSIVALIEVIDSDDSLLSDVQLHTLRAIRRGIQMGYHLTEQYRQRAGVADFKSAAGLSDLQKGEFNEKMQTAAAVMQFVTVQYILWDMLDLTEGNSFLGNISVDLNEVHFSAPTKATKCMLFYLGQHIAKYAEGSDDKLVAAVVGYAEAMQQEILNRLSSFKHLEVFTNITYQLEESDFAVSGFDLLDSGRTTSVEFNRVEMEEIVGNADAKHFARRMVKRMLCYNLAAQKNVFVELGGLTPIWMGYGKPGTGKSMLIAAIATMFQDYCTVLGIPFLFHPLPDNIIDSFQGNSAKNMVNWFKPMQDPGKLVFAPIDDGENILEERTRQGVSEGGRAAVSVFLRYTEGAYAINRGNSTIGILTNIPEQVDAAARSRVQGRMVIDGADSVEDFFDQDYIWFQKFADQKGFNNLSLPEYKYMAAQGLLKSMADASQTHDVPEHETVHGIFNGVVNSFDVGAHEFFANLYVAFMEHFKAFSSRDVRNIQSAVNQRIMDFDLPEEWFENPETFCGLEYDRQKEMIASLRNENMKGLAFADIYRQEVVRYLDNYARIADMQFDREVEENLQRIRVNCEVMRRSEIEQGAK